VNIGTHSNKFISYNTVLLFFIGRLSNGYLYDLRRHMASSSDDDRKRTNKRDAHSPDDDEQPNVFLSLSDAQEAMLRLKASYPFWQLSHTPFRRISLVLALYLAVSVLAPVVEDEYLRVCLCIASCSPCLILVASIFVCKYFCTRICKLRDSYFYV